MNGSIVTVHRVNADGSRGTAIAGATLYLALKPYVPEEIAGFAGMACIAAIRFAAIAWNLQLPVYTLDRKD